MKTNASNTSYTITQEESSSQESNNEGKY